MRPKTTKKLLATIAILVMTGCDARISGGLTTHRDYDAAAILSSSDLSVLDKPMSADNPVGDPTGIVDPKYILDPVETYLKIADNVSRTRNPPFYPGVYYAYWGGDVRTAEKRDGKWLGFAWHLTLDEGGKFALIEETIPVMDESNPSTEYRVVTGRWKQEGFTLALSHLKGQVEILPPGNRLVMNAVRANDHGTEWPFNELDFSSDEYEPVDFNWDLLTPALKLTTMRYDEPSAEGYRRAFRHAHEAGYTSKELLIQATLRRSYNNPLTL